MLKERKDISQFGQQEDRLRWFEDVENEDDADWVNCFEHAKRTRLALF